MVKVTDFLGFDPENMVIYWDLTKKHGDSNGDFMRFSLWCHSDFIQFQCVIYSDGISWVLDGLNGVLVRQIPRANSGVAMSLTGENWRM